MTPQEEYIELVPKVLFEFQWLEEGIKSYIVRAEVAIVSHVEKVFRYKPTVLKELGKMTLGRLVEYFACHDSNDELIRRLRAVVKERNHVAHGGYLLYCDESGNVPDIQERLTRLKSVYEEARSLVPLVLSECQGISARLGASIHGLPISPAATKRDANKSPEATPDQRPPTTPSPSFGAPQL